MIALCAENGCKKGVKPTAWLRLDLKPVYLFFVRELKLEFTNQSLTCSKSSMSKRTFLILFCVLVLITLALVKLVFNYDYSPLVAEVQFFSNPQCMSACWHDLIPGITSLSEVQKFFEGKYFIGLRTFDESRDYGLGAVRLRGFQSTNEYHVDTIIKDDILLIVELNSSYLDVKAEEIVQTLGTPESVIYSYSQSVEVQGPQGLMGFYTLYYPQKGYWFTFASDVHQVSKDEVSICPQNGDYASRISIFVSNSINPENFNIHPASKFSQWPGFTCIKLPYNT